MPFGEITVITGGMCSGKSSELLRQLRREEIASRRVIRFSPAADTRSVGLIRARDGVQHAALLLGQPSELLQAAPVDQFDVVGIDEVQFLPHAIVAAVLELSRRGQRVILAGLDTDFRGEPFGAVPHLLTIADHRHHLKAICVRCHAEATRSQRLIKGAPAPYEAQVYLPGGEDTYEARCRNCHEVPR